MGSGSSSRSRMSDCRCSIYMYLIELVRNFSSLPLSFLTLFMILLLTCEEDCCDDESGSCDSEVCAPAVAEVA
jgi:hypothetical protein